jgi:DNA (cytosine-5)-methyltransferase 1
MGYPTDFKIPVSDTQAYKQFGNSVVVPVVERLAKKVVETLEQPADFRPDLVLQMGERSEQLFLPAKRPGKPVRYKIKRGKNIAG